MKKTANMLFMTGVVGIILFVLVFVWFIAITGRPLPFNWAAVPATAVTILVAGFFMDVWNERDR